MLTFLLPAFAAAAKCADKSATKSMFGFSTSVSPQLQVKKLAATKEELLREALREIEGAKLIGREAVSEIVLQGGSHYVSIAPHFGNTSSPPRQMAIANAFFCAA